jgi:RelA/SpoT family (p)ppGpp synthetase
MTASKAAENAMIEKALLFAEKAHSDQIRQSGEPYITHLIAVRDMLSEVNADPETLIAALLHDTIEDTGTTFDQLKKEFGPTIAKLVEGVTKVQQLEGQTDKRIRNMQSIRKIFRTMGKDIRVMFIKLADRLHNMRTLDFTEPEKQQRIAQETLDIYCPVADLLGIDLWFRELSDLCFRTLDPTGYDLVRRKAEIAWDAQHKALEKWVAELKRSLHAENWKKIDVQIIRRNLEEIYVRTQGQESELQNLETFCTVHITIPNNADCYTCMGAAHRHVTLIPSEVHDFIAAPKLNGYSALHSSVMTPSGNAIDLIFQTEEMRDRSHFGALMMYRNAHTGRKSSQSIPEWVSAIIWLEQDEQDTGTFFDILHEEIFGERVRVYIGNNKRKHLEVPSGSTALDIAFYVDEQTGLHAEDVMVNNQEANMKTIVSEGDVLQFKKDERHVRRDASDLWYLRTSLARKLLVSHFSLLPKREQIRHGTALVQQVVDISMDPFFGIEWQKQIRKHIMQDGKDLVSIGAGVLNPFVYTQMHAAPEDFLLLDPKCFIMVSRMSPSAGMHYVLRTSLTELRAGNIIGLQSGPDVIDIISADILVNERRFSKEYVPIRTRTAFLEFPFLFALRFRYKQHANPLAGISTLQNILDTPVNLLQFDSGSVTLGFHTDSLRTVQSAYEYLSALPYVSDIFRITPP